MKSLRQTVIERRLALRMTQSALPRRGHGQVVHKSHGVRQHPRRRVIGAAVDVGTGSAYAYPPPISVELGLTQGLLPPTPAGAE